MQKCTLLPMVVNNDESKCMRVVACLMCASTYIMRRLASHLCSLASPGLADTSQALRSPAESLTAWTLLRIPVSLQLSRCCE